MDNQLKNIFDFLNDNQAFNTKVQLGFYRDSLLPYDNSQNKLRSLFWRVQNSQSQPRLLQVTKFWKEMEVGNFFSFDSLLLSLGGNPNDRTFKNLFTTLTRKASWGNKTSALFVRALYHLHVDSRYSHLSFLENTPTKLEPDDRIFLPVDIVITNIFSEIYRYKSFTFEKINNQILKDYWGEKMAVWDDLWFWGFITQNGTGNNREFIWNEEKYWSLLHTPKDPETIKLAKEKANLFIRLIKA